MKLHRIALFATLTVLVVLALAPTTQAAQRLVLIEGFTQWNCPPCANWNPQERAVLEAMTRDTVICIKYHAWWPAPNNDQFYLWNVSEQNARINFYGVSGVPTTKCDGLITVSQSQTALRNNIRTRYNTASPCTITLSAQTAGETAIAFTGTISAEQDMTNANMRLFVLLITDRIQYQSPPGSNGETIFDNIFRDFWPNSSGQAFTLLTDSTYAFEGTLNKEAAWEVEDLSVIAYIQIVTGTKEVLQSQLIEVNQFYGMEMTTTDPHQLIVQPNAGEALYYLELNNTGLNEDTYTVTLGGDIPDGWLHDISTDGVPENPDQIEVTLPGGGATTLVVGINPNGMSGSATFEVNVTSPNLPGMELEEQFRLMSGLDVLVVDDDDGGTVETWFMDALAAAETDYVIGRWDVHMDALDAAYFEGVELVIWFTGGAWQNGTTLTPNDQIMVGDYLDAGGKLFLTGQGIGWDLRTDPFYTEYLHATYIMNYTLGRDILGVEGDPISDGMDFAIIGGDGANNQTRQTSMNAADEFATPAFEWETPPTQGGFPALRITTANYRIVYLGFGFESISNAEDRNAVMANSIDWLINGTSAEDPTELVPGEFALGQNYPNPFNPETTIPYMLPNRADVTLRVFDVLGREVATLTQGMQDAGLHAFHWNTTELSSGIYFYRLEADNNGMIERATRKMMLMK